MLYQKYNNIFRKKRVTGRRRKTMMTWMKRIALLPSTLRARTICTSPASTEYTGRIQAQGTFSYSCMMIKRTIFYILIQINIHILKINDRLVRNNEAYIQKWRRDVARMFVHKLSFSWHRNEYWKKNNFDGPKNLISRKRLGKFTQILYINPIFNHKPMVRF